MMMRRERKKILQVNDHIAVHVPFNSMVPVIHNLFPDITIPDPGAQSLPFLLPKSVFALFGLHLHDGVEDG